MTLQILNEGETVYIQGSGKKPYEVKKTGGVVSCSCPAWRNMGGGIDTRVCKHIKANIDPSCLLPQAQVSVSGAVSAKTGLAVPPQTNKTTASPPGCLLANKWEDEDPTGWWMSEKLDGVRAWWTGEKFLSREGNEFFAPEWFKKLLPKNMVLDGELWMGRKSFQKTVAAVRKIIPNDTEWQDVKYVLFDAPNVPGTFEQRIEALKKLYLSRTNLQDAFGLGQVWVLEQIKCKNKLHMKKFLDRALELGGEGIMLRESGSQYESGRSGTCLKVKKFIDDEATVTGYTDGKGKHKGRVGALIVTWNNKEFELGTGLSDDERKNPPKIGAKVTFKYTDLTDAGIPKFASYLGVRDYE